MIAWVLAIVGTLVILKIVDVVDRAARVAGAGEIQGLDLSQHGEEGYNLEVLSGVLSTSTSPDASESRSLVLCNGTWLPASTGDAMKKIEAIVQPSSSKR